MKKDEQAVNRDAEWRPLRAFVRESSFDDELSRTKLVSLWTAFCFHQNLAVGSVEYHKELVELWDFMVRCAYPLTRWWANFAAFYGFMSRDL